jgi:flavin reductase (DIM6/NTAB) family NADH-FMN oxidoreductase RutF
MSEATSKDKDLDDAVDRMTRRVLWSLPTGLYLLGGGDLREGLTNANLMTVNLVCQVATTPRIIAVSCEQTSVTLGFVRASQQLSLSILDREDRAVVRKFVKPVTDGLVMRNGVATMAGQPVELGDTGLPRLAASKSWIEAKVVAIHEFESHALVLAQVRAVGEREDGELMQVLRMEDTRMNYGG